MTKRKYIMFDFGHTLACTRSRMSYGLVDLFHPTVMGLRRECGSMERINVGYVEAIYANLVARWPMVGGIREGWRHDYSQVVHARARTAVGRHA